MKTSIGRIGVGLKQSTGQLQNVRFLNAGYCVQAKFVTGRRSLGLRKFHSTFVHFEHPIHGESLIDTGYSNRFIKATNRIPHLGYRIATPLGWFQDLSDQSLYADQLVDRKKIKQIFVSHFHGDHIGGLKYFDSSKFIYVPEVYSRLQKLSGFSQVRHGFLSELVPGDIDSRTEELKSCMFGKGIIDGLETFDFWGDGSLVIVKLPGHFPGHVGFLLNTDQRRIFFVVDATWDVELMLKGRKLPFLGRAVHDNWGEYWQTQSLLRRYHEVAPDVQMLACHCPLTQQMIDRTNPGN